MPPHYNQIEPVPGGGLSDDTITITGYTLEIAEDPIVTDLTAPKKLFIELELETERVGQGLEMSDPPPGSIQVFSVLRVKLPDVPVGHKIQMEFLGDTMVWIKEPPLRTGEPT
jgi:hypothetical protein